MRVYRKEPRKRGKIMEIENTLDNLQAAVGGYIQAVYLPISGVAILCDEEGRLKGLDQNICTRDYGPIVGPVLFVGIDGEEFTGLNDDQIKMVRDVYDI